MPTFVQSAMNPNGTWQADALDQAEQSNRAAAFQAAQMQNEIAARQLQAHLEQMHMKQQGTQFEEGRADQLGMHNSSLENANRMQQAAFGHEDNAALARANVERDIASMQFGPNSLASRHYEDELAQRNLLMRALGLDGGQPAAAASPAATAVDLSQMKQMPPGMEHNPMAGYGSGAMPAPQHAPTPAPAAVGMQVPQGVDPMAYKLSLYNAALHGTQMPDFQGNALRTKAMTDELHQHELEIAQRRLQQAIDSGDTATQQQIVHDNPDLVMPRIDATSVAQRPEVQIKVMALDKARDASLADYAGPEDMAKLKLAMKDVEDTLTAHGVRPDEAHAIVVQHIMSGSGAQPVALPDRRGAIRSAFGRIGYGGAQPEEFGQTTKASRINEIHDLIGQ